MRPEGDEAKELQEIVAKRQKKGKVDDDKPLEEKSIFHSKRYIFNITLGVLCLSKTYLNYEISVLSLTDYQIGSLFTHLHAGGMNF